MKSLRLVPVRRATIFHAGRNKMAGVLVMLTAVVISGCGNRQPEITDQFVHCRSLDGDRTAERIFEWEFNAVADALREFCLPDKELTLEQIEKLVTARMSRELRDSLKEPQVSIRRVVLELEVRGEFVRVPSEDETAPRKLKRTPRTVSQSSAADSQTATTRWLQGRGDININFETALPC